jgi:hypothetical protein
VHLKDLLPVFRAKKLGVALVVFPRSVNMRVYEAIQNQLLAMRLTHPELPQTLAQYRRRRSDWTAQPLVIVAADHPARRVVAAGGNPWAMADRVDLLSRVAEVLAQPVVDGVLVTPDIFEELLVVNRWAMGEGAGDILADKVIVGSMNRGGLAETVFDLDDFFSAYTARGLVEMGLDAGKILVRVDPESRDSAQTLRYVVRALNRLDRVRLPVFLEPLSVPLTTEGLVRLVGVVTALGQTSVRRWLKLPMVEDFQRVAQASSLPMVLLGGGQPGRSEDVGQAIERCRSVSPLVRGIMMGRGVLYPSDGRSAAQAAVHLGRVVKPGVQEEVVPWLPQ